MKSRNPQIWKEPRNSSSPFTQCSISLRPELNNNLVFLEWFSNVQLTTLILFYPTVGKLLYPYSKSSITSKLLGQYTKLKYPLQL